MARLAVSLLQSNTYVAPLRVWRHGIFSCLIRSLVLAPCEGLSSALGVRAALRSAAAHGLAAGAVFTGRWPPSEPRRRPLAGPVPR
eukprot:103645-Pyramimonas_sp.AAC.1